MAMKTIEMCRVEPAHVPHTPSAPTFLPLTFFDLLWLRLPPVQRLFFYQFPHPPSLFFHSLLPKRKLSLSHSLRYFPPLSGHLTWPHHSPKPFISYVPGHDAVSLLITESHADFDLLSGFGLCEATQCHHLIPHLDVSHDQASVLALQVTLFPNFGFSIGISSHHAVLDGKTSTSFMKSWAYLCNHLQESSSSSSSLSSFSLAPDLVPFFDRSMIKDPKNLEARYVSDWLNHGGPNNRSLEVWDIPLPQEAVRGVFELTRSDIERLKHRVTVKNENLRLSTFIVCCAHSWVCRVRAEGMKSKRVQLAMNVDCRPRLEPPLPGTFFGNCIGNRMAVVETTKLLGEDGLVVAVEAIVGGLESLKDGVLNGAEGWVSLLQGGLSSDDKIIGIAGTPRFEVYSTDFGWGRPKKVEMASVDRTGAIYLSDSRNGDGGIEIGLVLKKNVMETFASLFVKGLESIS